jgi:hypothetical protein
MSFITDLFSEPETPDYSKAIEASKFTPYSVSTGFGTSNFNTDGKTAGYTLDPRLAGFRDVFYDAAKGMAPTSAQTDYANRVSQYGMDLFGRASNLDTGQIARDYYNSQQDILNPQRMQENVQLGDTLFKTGRTGVGVGMTNVGGTTGYINPEQFALLSAREGQNAELALNSTDRARQMQIDDINKALGYYGVGQTLKQSPYDAMNSLFGYGAGIEKLGLSPLTLGADLGTSASSAGANVGRLLAGQEDARVAAENTPGLFGSLLSSVASYAMPGIGGAIGKSLGSGWSSLFSGAPSMASNLSGVNNLSNTFLTRYGR